jgi:uncharacterized protein YfdQ (DUF2303 family)
MPEKNDAQTIADLAGFAAGPIQIEGVQALILPAGAQVRLFEDLLPIPRRIVADRKFATAASFCAYLQDYADPQTCRIYANREPMTLTAILDHLRRNEPSWASHRATLTLRMDPTWREWRARHRQVLTQEAFADYIEDHLSDIVEPDGALILETVNNLEATKVVKFARSIRLDNATVQLHYDEQEDAKIRGKGAIKVPTQFVLGIPYFEGDAPIRIEARLRHAIRDGELSFAFILDDLDGLAQRRFDSVCLHIEQETKCRLYHGTP